MSSYADIQNVLADQAEYLLGHSSPDMVRRYSSSYRSEQAATRHHRFSPADQMLAAPTASSR